jgi:hypothetical protein
VCKAQTDRTEQMIPVEAEDIPLVKQIAQVPRRVLHRTERHADRRIAVRVAARGAGQVGRDAGHHFAPTLDATDGHYGLLTPQASLVMSLCPQERGRGFLLRWPGRLSSKSPLLVQGVVCRSPGRQPACRPRRRGRRSARKSGRATPHRQRRGPRASTRDP